MIMLTFRDKVEIVKKAVDVLNRTKGMDLAVSNFKQEDWQNRVSFDISGGSGRGRMSLAERWFTEDYSAMMPISTVEAEEAIKNASPKIRPILKVMSAI
jgi:hypothetical protein